MATEEKAANSLVRPGFIISALLIVALILGLAVLLFTREDTGNAGDDKPVEVSSTTQASGGATPTSSDGVAAGAESDSVCGLVARDQVIPTQALPSVPVGGGHSYSGAKY